MIMILLCLVPWGGCLAAHYTVSGTSSDTWSVFLYNVCSQLHHQEGTQVAAECIHGPTFTGLLGRLNEMTHAKCLPQLVLADVVIIRLMASTKSHAYVLET